jgi:hypothetical protein
MALTIPRSWGKEYSKAIFGLQRDVREMIELTEADFNMLICDEWPFSPAVLETNAPLAAAYEERQAKLH